MADRRKRRSVDAAHFSMVPSSSVPRSAFDVSHTHKTTFDAGYLIPIYVDEVLPGDSHRVRMHALARLATPLTPVMDNLILESFFFFVPNRLLWENWEAFMGEQEPGAVTEYLVPITNVGSTISGNPDSMFASYMGVVNQDPAALPATTVPVSALPFRAYNLIYNEWFRDQDLQASAFFTDGDGPDDFANYVLLRRNKRHDYFTSARPWPQKPTALTGFGSSMMNLIGPGYGYTFPGGTGIQGAGAPVTGFYTDPGETATANVTSLRGSGGRNNVPPFIFSDTANTLYFEGGTTLSGAATNFPNVRVLVNDIRTAQMVQVIMEKNARGGTRYAETVFEHFRVRSPDARLQRPEYLGGGRTFVNVSAVAQTSATKANDPDQPGLLGEQAGVGTAVVQNHGFSQSFTEHGWIIGLVNVRADLSYQQGINRMWNRRSKYDFFLPALEGLGEQAILSREIYADGTGNNTGQLSTSTGDYSVFGYQERWSEYKYKPNRVSGWFQSYLENPLDQWHFAQDFGERPVLNSAFVQEDPPIDRVLQVEEQPWHQFLMDALFDIRLVRPMRMYSIPGVSTGRF